jgi:hypothetical protein
MAMLIGGGSSVGKTWATRSLCHRHYLVHRQLDAIAQQVPHPADVLGTDPSR